MDPLIKNLADYFGELVEKQEYNKGVDDAFTCHPVESLRALTYLTHTGKLDDSNPIYNKMWRKALATEFSG